MRPEPARAAEAPLAALLPAAGSALSPDAVLDRFVSWVTSTGLTLYSHQEEGILHLLDDRHLVLATPTGSGKSLVATFLHFQAMAAGKRSFYTCPIKALVNEKFFDLCRLFGPDNVGMMTGDAAVNRDAPIVCCTAEILMNLAVREADPRADAVVMDEFHYYGDRERGVAWQVPLLTLTRHASCSCRPRSATPRAIEASLAEITGPRGGGGAGGGPAGPARVRVPRDAAPRDASRTWWSPARRPSTWSTSPSAPPPSRPRTS